ncbi:hypothetical protein YC2023_094889 [Brassica napus]
MVASVLENRKRDGLSGHRNLKTPMLTIYLIDAFTLSCLIDTFLCFQLLRKILESSKSSIFQINLNEDATHDNKKTRIAPNQVFVPKVALNAQNARCSLADEALPVFVLTEKVTAFHGVAASVTPPIIDDQK